MTFAASSQLPRTDSSQFTSNFHLGATPAEIDENPSQTVALYQPLPSDTMNLADLIKENKELRRSNADLSARLLTANNPQKTMQAMELVCQRIAKYILTLESENRYLKEQVKNKDVDIETMKKIMRSQLTSIVNNLNKRLLQTLHTEVPNLEEIIRIATRQDGTIDIAKLIQEVEISKKGSGSDEWLILGPNKIEEPGENDLDLKGWVFTAEESSKSERVLEVHDEKEGSGERASSEFTNIIAELKLLQKLYGETEVMRAIKPEDLIDENGKKMTKMEALCKLYEYLKIAGGGLNTTGKGLYWIYRMIIKLSPLIGVGLLFAEFPVIPLLLLEFL